MTADPQIAAAVRGRWGRRLAVIVFALLCLAAGLALGVYPFPALLGAGALVFVVFLCFRSELVLPLALFAVPFDLLGHVTEDGSVTVAKLLILLAIVIWTARMLLLKDQHPVAVLLHPVSLLMVAFLAVNILSLVNVIQLKPALIFLERRTNVVVFALLIAVVLRDRRSWDRALVWMTLASIPIGMFGMYELVTGRPILALVSYRTQDQLLLLSGHQWRIHGTFDDGPFHAIYVVTATGLALCWLLRTRVLWLRIALSLLLLLLFVNLVGTGSRGGMMALGVLLFVFWLGYGGRRKWVLAGLFVLIAVAVLGLALMMPQIPVHRYLQVSSADDPTSQIRMGLYSVGFDMVAKHPLLGVGTGNWLRNYQRFSSSSTFKKIEYMPHNTYLQVAAENGLLGLTVYLLLLAAALYQYLVAFSRSTDYGGRPAHAALRQTRLAMLAAMGAFLAFAVFALTSNVLENETYWIFIGFSIVASGLPAAQSEVAARAS